MAHQFGFPPFSCTEDKKHLSECNANKKVVASACFPVRGVSVKSSAVIVLPKCPKENSKATLQSFPSTNASLSDASLIVPNPQTVTIPSKVKTKRIGSRVFFHLISNARPRFSSNGLMFLLGVRRCGIQRTVDIAEQFHWKYKRALRTLLDYLSEKN